ncbi:hypothetical protein BGZ83_000509 [Gryganskiella cystojenkinii]|nr:hypothetical protein BGZ83_000509 [Gryganskiella cystojenkinii]
MATSTPTGPGKGNDGLLTTLEEQILQLADHEAWLDAQIRELEFAYSHETETDPQDSQSAEETKVRLEQNIDILKQELYTTVSMDSVRTKVLDSAQAYQVVLKSLFKNEHDVHERSLANAIQERDKAVSEYLHIHRELQQTRRELSSVQIRVLDSQDENRKLAQLLASETTAMKEALASQDSSTNRRMTQRMEEELKIVTMKHSVVSNVLQGLFLESNVDWVNDPHYLDVMLKLKRSE